MVSVTISYQGVAPIPGGSKVRVLVDDTIKPRYAYEIQDMSQNIVYRRALPPEPKQETLRTERVPDYVTGEVENCVIHSSGTTELTLLIV